MIELPAFAVPGSFSAEFIDAGFTQRGLQSSIYIPRKGARYKVGFTFGPYSAEQGRVMIARLVRGKQEGLRVELPILHSQGNPGAPLVNGAVVTGRVLPIKGLTSGYVVKEGYWLSIVIANQHYLHCVEVGGMADGGGNLSITLTEMLREELAGDEVIHLAKPMVEGLVDGDTASWNYSVNRVIPIEFTIEEKA